MDVLLSVSIWTSSRMAALFQFLYIWFLVDFMFLPIYLSGCTAHIEWVYFSVTCIWTSLWMTRLFCFSTFGFGRFLVLPILSGYDARVEWAYFKRRFYVILYYIFFIKSGKSRAWIDRTLANFIRSLRTQCCIFMRRAAKNAHKAWVMPRPPGGNQHHSHVCTQKLAATKHPSELF
jgi:hypothetical protein